MSDPSKTVLLTQFIEGLSQASAGAWSMVHQHQDSRFLPIRDRLDLIKQKAIIIAVKATHEVANS